MKSKLIVLVLTILYLNFYYIELSVAQTRSDVCTPKGNSVIAYMTTENLDNMRAYYDNYYANAYPNAEQIITYDGYSSTRRFNCHGYAWHISDGGSARWIGMGSPYDNNPEYQYWQDGSYSEVSGYVPYPGKVNWASGDHSAITTTESGVLISKWNEYPLMKHAWNDSPYGTSNLKYYKLNFQINGPSVLCNSPEAFSISNTPGGAITWTNSNNTSRVSNQGSNPCNFSSVSNGSGWINASFITACGTSFILPQKSVWAGRPDNSQIDMIVMFGQSPGNILCTNMEQTIAAGHPNIQQQFIDGFYWDFGSWSQYQTGYDLGGPVPNSRPAFYLDYYAPSPQVIKVKALNQCDKDYSMTYAKSKTFYAQNCFGYFLAISPNPADSETKLSIETTSTEEIVDEPAEWELEVYSPNQDLKEKKTKLNGSTVKIQTAGWKEGVYVVRVKYKDEILTGKLVVKK